MGVEVGFYATHHRAPPPKPQPPSQRKLPRSFSTHPYAAPSWVWVYPEYSCAATGAALPHTTCTGEPLHCIGKQSHPGAHARGSIPARSPSHDNGRGHNPWPLGRTQVDHEPAAHRVYQPGTRHRRDARCSHARGLLLLQSDNSARGSLGARSCELRRLALLRCA